MKMAACTWEGKQLVTISLQVHSFTLTNGQMKTLKMNIDNNVKGTVVTIFAYPQIEQQES